MKTTKNKDKDTSQKICAVEFDDNALDNALLEPESFKDIKLMIEQSFDIASSEYIIGGDMGGNAGEKLEVFVMFTNNEEMQRINKEQRDIDTPTDVLSFPLMEAFDGKAVCYELDINPETDRLMMGDIIISLEQAAKQAVQYGHSLLREITFLALHGLLHLMGYDHQDPMREQVMRNKQREILDELNIKRD